VALLFAVRTDARRPVPPYSGESDRVATGSIYGVFLLEEPEDGVDAEGGGVHGREDRRLQVLVLVAEGINKEKNLKLIEVDRADVGDLPCMARTSSAPSRKGESGL
jgi:hypothetical protein